MSDFAPPSPPPAPQQPPPPQQPQPPFQNQPQQPPYQPQYQPSYQPQQPPPQQPPPEGGYQGGSFGYPTGTTPTQPGSGLAITSMVLGILAILGCLIPFVNISSILLGIGALVTGLIALSKARKGTGGGKGFGIAGIALGIVSILVAIAVLAFTLVAVVAVDEGITEAVEAAEAEANGEGSVADEDAVQDAGEALALGTVASVDEYDITVVTVNQNANEVIAAASEFNEPPTGQYVLVTMSVVYTGTDEGDPWLDLTTAIQGSDARQYDSSSCLATVPIPAIDVPTLTAGGAATYELCMDVPPAALDGATVFAETSFNLGDDDRSYWNIQ